MAYTTEELGRLIARAHYQAWRADAPPFDLSVEELAVILPNLIKSGSAGIVWHRVKPFRERYGALAYALEAATDAQIAHNQRVEKAVVECVTRLRAYGIEPVLVKGLALAKLYPEGIVRPAGDIDLVVHKEEFAAACAILRNSTREPIPVTVDLKHPAVWKEAPGTDFWKRLRRQNVLGDSVHALEVSDDLLMNCLHYLKHGGRRPIWLSDIALLAERLTLAPPLASNTLAESWVKGLLGACSTIVGVDPQWMDLERKYPEWIGHSMTTQLAIVLRSESTVSQELFDSPIRVLETFRRRWPDPLTAHWRIAKEMGSTPPQYVQLLAYVWQIQDYAVNRSLHQGYTQIRAHTKR